MSITKIPVLWAFVAVALYAQPHPAMPRLLFEPHLAKQHEQHREFDAQTAPAAPDLGLFLRGHGDNGGPYRVLSRTVFIDEKVFGLDAPRTGGAR